MEAQQAVAHRIVRIDVVLVVTAVVLGLLTGALLLVPGVWPRAVFPALDLTLDTVALVVTGCVASLAWLRYRERRHVMAVYQAAGFMAIALANVAAVATTLLLRPNSTLASTEPGPEQLSVFLASRLVCGALLIVGASRGIQGAVPRWPVVPLILTAVVMLAAIGLVAMHAPLPHFVEATTAGPPRLTPTGTAFHLVAAAMFGVAAWLSRRVGIRDGSLADQYIAVALLIGAFALLQDAVLPATHPGPVTSADLLWLAFNITLLLAIEAEAQWLLGATRAANRTLVELHAAEVDRAALRERARLSRELHDGLAQDLWLAKLKVARLASLSSLDDEARAIVEDVAEAVEVGLAEARQAVIATRAPAQADGAFGEILRQYLEDHADRFGLRVDYECEREIPRLPTRTQAELLRIAQEALSNVRRHAGATSVAVQVEVVEQTLVLRITDDGCGFDIAGLGRATFGLASMRERAGIAGGRFGVTSRPGVGTRVAVVIPIPDGDVDARRPALAGVVG